ncbi:MAG: tetratricopeptide repeat protein [Pyrinomonadaceae bacterium]
MNNGISDLREFGKCRLDVGKKVLWCEEKPVPLPLKALELLSVLVERNGEVVTKDEIWGAVWQDSFVEETNLTHNIYLLRKTLRDLGEMDLIQTVPRRGYRFTGAVRVIETGELVIEKYTQTRTLIEEIETGEEEIPDARKTVPENLAANRPVFLSRGKFLIPAAILTLVASSVFVFWRFYAAGPPNVTETKSIVVVPIRNLTGEADNETLSDGMTESLMTELGKLQGVKVISHTSSFSLKNTAIDHREIGKKFNVSYLLEGSLRLDGEILRVETRLVRTATGEIVWSETYEKPLENILIVQDGIACQVANELRESFCGQKDRVPPRYVENIKAYRAYMKGRFYWHQRGDKPLVKAIAAFEEALQYDPNYALAYVGLAETYVVQEANSTVVPSGAVLPKAIANAEKALELDPNLAGAYTALGMARRIERNLDEAERMFQRAIEINPNYATAWHWRATTLRVRGRFPEAEAAIKKAQELDPLSIPINLTLGEIYFSMHDFDRVLEQADHIFSLSPENENGYFLRAEGLEMLGRSDEALAAVEKVHPLNSGYLRLCILARSGRRDEALRSVSEMERSEAAVQSPYNIARVYAALDEREKALDWLEKAYDIGQPFLFYLKGEPRFDSLRSTSRYRELLRKLNLE